MLYLTSEVTELKTLERCVAGVQHEIKHEIKHENIAQVASSKHRRHGKKNQALKVTAE